MEMRERLAGIARKYNEAIESGKKREAQKVATRSHNEVWQAIQEIESQPTVDRSLLADTEALLMDIRWGQRTERFLSVETMDLTTSEPNGEHVSDGEVWGMESRLVPSVAVASFDHEIVSGLKIRTVGKWSMYPRMQIAVRNDAGDAYRTIGIDGMGDWVNTLQWFIDRGYTDEIGPDGGTWKGCDAVFGRKV